ncbi:PEP-CTERM sorting domain-containing protein [Opitutaceae bacterium]|nr:PEP-CTERM sorting domain-containing protein [Opitutaceae bacterium]
MKKVSALVTFLCLSLVTSAQTLFTYTFDSAATDQPTVTGLSFNSVSSTAQGTISFSASNYIFDGGFSNSATLDSSTYFSFTITVDSGYTMDLTSFSFDGNRSGTGPANSVVEVFLNSSSQGTSSAFVVTDESGAPSGETNTFDHTDLTSVTATGQVEYRIYGYNASGSGNFRVDNLTAIGTVSAVPEPSSFAALAGLAMLGFVATRRRSRATLA